MCFFAIRSVLYNCRTARFRLVLHQSFSLLPCERILYSRDSLRMTLDQYSHTRSNRPTIKVSQLSRSLTLIVHARLFLHDYSFARIFQVCTIDVEIHRNHPDLSEALNVKRTADQLVALIEKNISFPPAFSLRWDGRSCLSNEEAFTRKCFVAPRYIYHIDVWGFLLYFPRKEYGIWVRDRSRSFHNLIVTIQYINKFYREKQFFYEITLCREIDCNRTKNWTRSIARSLVVVKTVFAKFSANLKNDQELKFRLG